MDCANCALTLERSLAQIPGVEQVEVNFSTTLLQASGDFDPEKVIERVQALGYQVVEPGSRAAQALPSTQAEPEGRLGFLRYLLASRNTQRAAGVAVLLVAAL